MRAEALQTLLKTVLLQTLQPDQILIIDGSTNDETRNLIENLNVGKIEYYQVNEKHRGLTKQRNFGVSKVNKESEIVCFLDDDTRLDKNYFEELLSTYEGYPDALAVCGYITNETQWRKTNSPKKNEYYFDGYARKEGQRYKLRKKLGIIDNTPPGFMPSFSNGRPVSFLPPSNKVYEAELIMGGVSSYKKEIFKELSFSSYFEGYGLYEDADFSLRVAKLGKLYVNTAAKLEHHHDSSGRPNMFKYGKMVSRNGWYVWRVKYEHPSFKSRFLWNTIAIVQTFVRFSNVFTTSKRQEALYESLGRLYGWMSLLFNKPTILR